MKTMTKTIATLILGAALLTSTAFAGCGEQTNGSKCLVDSPTTGKTVSKLDTRIPFDFEKEIGSFFRDIFSKIFG